MLISARARLEDLLLSMFTPEELRRALVRWREELDLELSPWSSSPPAAFVHDAVGALSRHGFDGPELFEYLERLRPDRAQDIRLVGTSLARRDRKRFVVEIESQDPERDLAAFLDAMAEARAATGDPTLRVLNVWRGSLLCLFEGWAVADRSSSISWLPDTAKVVELREPGNPLRLKGATLREVALRRCGGVSAWSTLELVELDRVWGSGDALGFRSSVPPQPKRDSSAQPR